MKDSLCCLLLATVLTGAACSRDNGLPSPDSEEYRRLVSAFYVGLSGLQTGEDVRAASRLTEATELAPGEPAGWANLGLLALRHQDFERASEYTERARTLAPDNTRIEALLGLIESRRGNLAGAIAHLTRAVELDTRNLRALYSLSQETERQAAAASDAEAQSLLEGILETQPDNLAVLLDLARLAAKRGDDATLRAAVSRLASQSASWPAGAREQLTALERASTDPQSAGIEVAFLRNVLTPTPDFRRSLNAVQTPVEFAAEPFTAFLKLPSPGAEPAPPDLATTFSLEALPGAPIPAQFLKPGVIAFDDASAPTLVLHTGNELQIAGGVSLPLSGAPDDIAALDYDYDFKTDLATVGSEGLRIFRQVSLESFTDVTANTKLPPRVLRTPYRRAWTFDFDLDGDLDLLLSPAASGPPVVARNNGDGTFREMLPFDGLRDVRDFASADIDGDGDPDLAFVTATGLQVLTNERLGQYRARPDPQAPGEAIAVTAADMNGDAMIDFVVLTRAGRVVRLSDDGSEAGWSIAQLARTATPPEGVETATLLLADLDNNGGLDIISDADVLLGDAQGFSPVSLPSDVRVRAVIDVNADGRLDLIGVQGSPGALRAVRLINRGAKNYHYQIVRTRAAQATGDQRINSFGIGGEMEIRSGLLTQKQIIASPTVHFGLGENTSTDVARIVWPNGLVQAEFELAADTTILAEQRLKGSCPMLFAWDGEQIRYVKDTAPWSPALGLHINSQVTADIYQTEEWFRIRGDQIAPRDGVYDLRVTAELWEVYYIDHYSLMAVDHPEGTEVFVDERFAVPPPALKLHPMTTPKPFAMAFDDLGGDVLDVVNSLDEKYLGTFGKGRYQGITRDHWVEVELPAEAPHDKPLYLVGHGFLQPTDGSINIAYSQTSAYAQPEGLSIETPDASGRWSAARSGLGFPAGKLKTVTLDLDGVFKTGAPRRLRLRTNMEIYWDKLEWAEALPDDVFKTHSVDLKSAELRWRGFSEFNRADETSPELPNYNRLAATAPIWRNMVGYYTRHGDVRELLNDVDGRMVIVNAGDEIRLRFAALPPPAEGMTRDFVMIGDGWIKDGDLNSTFSKTVAPLPYRGLKDYDTAYARLEDEPAYKLHPQDWRQYHTRYVTPDLFRGALRN